MISQREVTRRYSKLLKSVAEDDFYKIDLANRVNCYTCELGHITKTQDIDAGVTPMMMRCRVCGYPTRSSFYKDIAPELKVHGVWYRPTLKQVMKMRKNPAMLDHILSGGLEYKENEVNVGSLLEKMQQILQENGNSN